MQRKAQASEYDRVHLYNYMFYIACNLCLQIHDYLKQKTRGKAFDFSDINQATLNENEE